MPDKIKYYLSDMYFINIEYTNHKDTTTISLSRNYHRFIVKEFKNRETDIDDLGSISDILDKHIKVDLVQKIDDIVKDVNKGIYDDIHTLYSYAKRIDTIMAISKHAKYYFKYSSSAFDEKFYPGGTMEDYWDTEKQRYKEILNNYKNGGK